MAASGNTVTCPEGHESEATDFCDTCGVAITAGPGPGAPAAAPPASPTGTGAVEVVGTCSNCGTNRIAGEAFCEVCGLDFATGKLPQAPSAAPAEAMDPAGAAPAGEPSGWTLVVTTDREWFDHNEAESGRVVEFPEDAAPRTIQLAGDLMAIGRRDETRGWYPGIDLGVPVLDPSTSRKHAELRRTDDGWELVDVGSTNGTVLDGERLTSDTPVAVTEGSVIHVGAFTRLVVHEPEASA